MPDHKRVLISDADFCAEMGVNNRTSLRWRNEGVGPRFMKIGGAIRYDRADVDAWLRSRTFEHRAGQITGRSAA